MIVTRRCQSVTTAVIIAVFCLAAPSAAQTGRASGTVRDQAGKPIRSATVRADNPSGYPSQVTSTTDDKGRWAMIGLSSGEWRFTVEAPGFVAQSGSITVRAAGAPPLGFVLPRDPGPIPGALDRNIQQQISAANALRDQGQVDQALSAYQEIRSRNQKLTNINLLIADAYRRKAATEPDPGARRSLLQLAITSYDELLKADASNERARAELDSVRRDVATTTNGTTR
jgi:tetratricopeptide (TPR) repeat protein